jgi:CSLREA domain-containing protein
MYPVSNPARETHPTTFSPTAWVAIKLLVLCLVTASVPLALYVRVDSMDSKEAITVQAAGRGGQALNLQDGREMRVEYRGDQFSSQALQSGAARARAVAAVDLDDNGTPDLVAGYANNGGGIVTVQRGNTDAFAPVDDSVFTRIQAGYNPDSLSSIAEIHQVPEPADFVVTGDFNQDSVKDVLVAANGGGVYLMAGDGEGRLAAAEQIALSGSATALAAGEFGMSDGKADLAVGVFGSEGPSLLLFSSAEGGLSAPLSFPLKAQATSIQFGNLDQDPFLDIVVAAGNEIEIIHGWGRKNFATAQSRVESIDVPNTLRGLALGNFIWDRENRTEIAAQSADGTVSILQLGTLDTRPFSEEEVAIRVRMRGKVTKQTDADILAATSWPADKAERWNAVKDVAVTGVVGGAESSQGLLVSSHISWQQTDDLLVLDAGQNSLKIVQQADAGVPAAAGLTTDDFSTTSLDVTSAPVAVAALPRKINGERDLVLLGSDRSAASIIPLAPTAIFTVTKTADTNDGVCNADCSLREAVAGANASPGSTVQFGLAGTFQLTINGAAEGGFCQSPGTGDLDISGNNTTITGLGAASTIIQQTQASDRVLCVDQALAGNFTFNMSGVTITGGRETFAVGGGGMVSGAANNNTTVSACTFSNNQETGASGPGGGGINNLGGSLTVTNCTVGGTSNPGASQLVVAQANSCAVGGGGLSHSPGDPLGRASNGVLTVTGSTFQNNTAASGASGGGGADVFTHNLGTGSHSFATSTFLSNKATVGNGGGIIVESLTCTVATSTFTTNAAQGASSLGGGIYLSGGALTLNGTSPTITFSGNTAVSFGDSISTAATVTVQGTNTTIGGDIHIATNGIWNNSAGSALSPTDVFIDGGTLNMNNSTMTVTGNLTLDPGPAVGGTFNGNTGTVNIAGNFTGNAGGAPATAFNAGTGTFNFNGSGAQAINGSLSRNFNNLIVNKSGGSSLTLGVNIGIISNLTVTAGVFDLSTFTSNRTALGGILTVSNGATLRIAGSNSMPSNFSTYTLGATSTVEYYGTGTQTIAAVNYGHLTSSSSGARTLANAGTIGIAGVFTPGTNAYTITGSTIDFNGSVAQTIPAFNYNNLTSSNTGARTLANSGTVGIAGVFTQGTNAYTITGSTINFNGAGAQTIPAFNYNNLTSSSTGARTLANAGTIGIAGVFTPGTNVYTITGSTIDFNGSVAQTISAFNYNNLTSSNTGARILAGAGTIGIFNVFTPGTNSYTITGSTVNFNGTGAQTVNAFNYNSLSISGARTVNNVTLASGTIGIAGIFSPTASFTSGVYVITGNTIDFNGSIPQAIPAFNYNNLTSSNVGARTLANSGTIGIAAVFTPGTNAYTISGSTIDFNGSGAQTIPAFNYNNLTSSNIGARTLAGSGSIGIAGVFTPGTNVYTITGSTVVYNGGSPQTMPATFTTYNNLTLNNLNGVTGFAGLTVQGLLRVQAGTFTSSSTYNNVQIDVGATMVATALSTINVSGNWTNNGTFTPSTGTVVFNGANNTQTLVGNTTFNNLTINHTGTGNVTAVGSTVGATGLLRVQSGTFIIGAGTFNNVQIDSGQTLQGTNATTVNVSGNWTNNGGTFTTNGNTVNFNGAGAQSIGGTSTTQTFDNFTVNKTGGSTLSVAASTTTLDINGNVTLTLGTFAAGTATAINVAGNWTNNATFTGGAGTVIFDGNNNTQTLSGTTTFNNLTINHTGTGNVTAVGSTLAVTGLLRVQGGTFIVGGSTFNNVQIDAAQTLQGTNATTINVSGNWTNDGGSFIPSGNTVNFNGAAAQNIGGLATTQTFDNFTVNKSGGSTLSGAASTNTLDINGNVTLTLGTFAAGTATSISVAGNWTNNGGVFTPGAGTVTFDGGVGQTIGGTTATIFGNLTNGNVNGLAMANDNTVNGILALTSSDITVAATRTLTQPAAGSSTGAFDVNGRVQRTGFVTGGAALSFGNPLNTIQVTANIAPANVVVDLTRTAPSGFATAVQRTYTITPSAVGFTGTLRLRYLESELNGNVEGPNFIFRRFNGTGWAPVLPTSSDFTNNWLEATGVTEFSPWTFNSTNAPTAADGVITGRIVDANGAPVEGAVVRLEGTQNRKFITDANGVYRFEQVETSGFYTVTPSRANYTFNPAVRSFSNIGQTTEAAFSAIAAAGGFVNPLDTPEYFVRQHYLDFLGREPDEAGFNYWSDQIIGCGADQQCIGWKRENVSAAYFLSIEFQTTGGLVDSLYRVGFGVRPNFAQFMPDTRLVAQGVVVGKDGWQAKLQANKEAFVADFVNRPAFHAAYDGLSSSDFVDTLISHTGVSFTATERDALVSGLSQGTMTRAEALTAIAENDRFESAKFNDAFVMMEYFGYLRRDADALGFQFWLDKLNQFGGNFQQAEMVKAFIVSGEYRDRFPK